MRLDHVKTLCYNKQHKLQFSTPTIYVFIIYWKILMLLLNCAF